MERFVMWRPSIYDAHAMGCAVLSIQSLLSKKKHKTSALFHHFVQLHQRKNISAVIPFHPNLQFGACTHNFSSRPREQMLHWFLQSISVLLAGHLLPTFGSTECVYQGLQMHSVDYKIHNHTKKYTNGINFQHGFNLK